MAFTFKVEDGTGYSDSNSYVSVEDADTYLEIDIHEQSWPALDDTVKEKLLALATREIDQKVVFKGEKTVEDSALAWPRSCVKHPNGTPVEVDEIPSALKQATIELARTLVSGPSRDPQATQGLEEIEVDVIRLKFTDGQINSFPATVQRLLRPYGQTQTDKPSFAKIKRS
jgi:hypothetical protein